MKKIIMVVSILGVAFIGAVVGPLVQAARASYYREIPGEDAQVADVPESTVSFITREKGDNTSQMLEYAPDEVIFKLTDPNTYKNNKATEPQQLVQQIVQKHRFMQINRVFSDKTRGPLKQIYVARLSAGTSPIDACKELKADPSIEWAELNYYYHCQMTPNDTYYNSSGSWGQGYADMWGLHAVNPENAWNQTQGNGIIVAVIDTGVDYNHEDLYRDSNSNGLLDVGEQYNVWVNPGEDLNGNGIVDPNDFNGIDDDENTHIDDICGWNFVSEDNNCIDDHGHGSHCAGIIAAVGNNSKGIIGVAPLAKIMIVKGLNSGGSGSAASLANGIVYAANNGARVLSNSWGGGGYSQAIKVAVDYARSRNCVVVAAAGNNAINAALFCPANIQGVLTVAALDPSLARASFSNYGSVVNFSAPGVDVLSLRAAETDMYNDGEHFVPDDDPNAKYYRANGTSMACPFVSGVSALLLGQDPCLPETVVRRVLASSTAPVATTNTYIGTGIVDANAALEIADQISDVNAAITQPENDLEPIPAYQNFDIQGTANGDSYVLEYGDGYYPSTWNVIGSGTSVTDALLGTLDLSDKQGPYHIRLTVNDGAQTAIEHTVLWVEPDLHFGWPVNLGGSAFYFGGFVLGASYTATPADADYDGNDEIFISSSGHTFGLKGDGTILPGWPTTQIEYPSYYSNASHPGPSVANVDNDANMEILWTLRDYWPDYNGSPSTVWCFNGKNLDGSNMTGFPQRAIEEHSNALSVPFVLADLNGSGTLKAIAAHTKGNKGADYRISAYDHQGNRLFTHDFPDSNEDVRSLSFGDMDANGSPDTVVVTRLGYESVRLHLLDSNGYEQQGYPVLLRNLNNEDISAPPFLADLDRDGDLEVVVGTTGLQSYIFCCHHNGSLLAGSPIPIGNEDCQIYNYSLGDVTGDGQPEIIVMANYRPVSGLYRVYVMQLDGTALSGFPYDVGEWPTGTPSVVDVDNDGLQDICFTTLSGSVYALSGSGQPITGFPKKMSFSSTSGVSAGDVDGDGLFELITATMAGGVYVWDTPAPAVRENSDWPMRHLNPRNTNVFGDNVLALSSDLNRDGIVNFADLAVFALAWLTEPPDLQWNQFCDIAKPPDNYIDWPDLDVLAEHWLGEH